MICLEALEHQTYPEELYEIIVVDNGSEEDIAPLVVEFSHVRYEYEPQTGSYAARNKGLEVARGEVIVFTDSDCIPARDWIELGVTELKNEPESGLVAGRIELFFRRADDLTLAEHYERVKAFRQSRNVEKDHFGVTANLFTWRSVVDKVGPFDADLISGGDMEWGRRVFDSGYRLIYAREVLVNHPARHSITQLVKKVVRTTKGGYGLTRFHRLKRYGPAYLAKWLVIWPYTDLLAFIGQDDLGIGLRLRLVFLRLMLHYIHWWTVFWLLMQDLRLKVGVR